MAHPKQITFHAMLPFQALNQLGAQRRELNKLKAALEEGIERHDRFSESQMDDVHRALAQTTSTTRLTTLLGTTGHASKLESVQKIETRMDEVEKTLQQSIPRSPGILGNLGGIGAGTLGVLISIREFAVARELGTKEMMVWPIVCSCVVAVVSPILSTMIRRRRAREKIIGCADEVKNSLRQRLNEFERLVNTELEHLNDVIGRQVA